MTLSRENLKVTLVALLDQAVVYRQYSNLGYLNIQERAEVEVARGPYRLSRDEFAYQALKLHDSPDQIVNQVDRCLNEILSDADAVNLEGLDPGDFTFLKQELEEAVHRQWNMTPLRRTLGYWNRRPKVLLVPVGMAVLGLVTYLIMLGPA